MISRILITFIFVSSLSACNFLADTDLSAFGNRESSSDACYTSCLGAVVGDPCGGGIYVGEFGANSLITTPGNCTDSSFPICDGATDTLTKEWALSTTVTNATNLDDGRVNTNIVLSSGVGSTPAVSFCNEMTYGGCSDWYLPARDELIDLVSAGGAIGGFVENYYWSSTEDIDNTQQAITRLFSLSTPQPGSAVKTTTTYFVRCVRLQ